MSARRAARISCRFWRTTAAALQAALVFACPVLAQDQAERQTKLMLPHSVPQAGPTLISQLGHRGKVNCLSLRADGKKLVSGGQDGYAIIYDVESGVVERIIPGHPSPPISISLSPDGHYLACGLINNSVVIWDLTGKTEPNVLDAPADYAHGHPVCVAYSPAGHYLAIGGTTIGEKLPVTRVELWDDAGTAVISRLECEYSFKSFSFSPDGRRVAVVSSQGHGDHPGTCVLVGDISQNRVVANWRIPAWRPDGDMLDLSPDRIVLSPDGKTVALGGTTHGPENPREWVLFDIATRAVLTRLKSRGSVLAFTGDGSAVCEVARDGAERLEARVQDWRTGVKRVLAVEDAQAQATETVADLVVSSDRGELTAASIARGPDACGATTWSIETGCQIGSWRLDSTRHSVVGLRPSQDGRRLLEFTSGDPTSTQCDGSAVLWDLSGGGSASFTPADGPVSRQFDLNVLKHREFFRQIPLGFGNIGNRPDALWIAPGGRAAMTVHRSVYDGDAGVSPRVLLWHWVLPDPHPVSFVALPAPSALLPRAGYRAGGVPYTPESFRTDCRFSPDGRFLAVSLPSTATVCLWDLRDPGEPLLLTGQAAAVVSLGFSQDGRKLASGGTDGTVLLWDVLSGELQARLSGHLGVVTAVCFLADGRLATGSDDGLVLLWDTRGWLTQPAVAALHVARRMTCRVLGLEDGSSQATEPWRPATPPLTAALFSFQTPVLPNGSWGAALPADPDWLVALPQGLYDGSDDVSKRVAWLLGGRAYPFDQFEGNLRRADVVQAVLSGKAAPAAGLPGALEAPPQVSFRSPTYGAKASAPETTIVLAASGGKPIQRISLTVNGRPAPEVASQLTADAPKYGERVFTVSLPAQGSRDLRLRAVAYDTTGLCSRPAELLLRGSGADRPTGGTIVLSIGLSQYRNAAWNTIHYASADATAFADLFARRAKDLKARRVLTDRAATLTNAKFALRWLKDTATEDDVAAVFIAGHGVQDAQGEYYFLCHDSNEADLKSTALAWGDFIGLLSQTRARKIMLFADTCHAGFVTGNRVTEGLLDRLNSEAGVMVFAASRGEETSVEREDWGHGAFTYALLEGLDGKADKAESTGKGDGEVTLSELKDYVAMRVADLTGGRQHPYLPRLENYLADEPLFEAAEGRPVRALAFSPDGRKLFSSGGDMVLWDVTRDPPAVAHRLMDQDKRFEGPDGLAFAKACFSPDGRWVATAQATLALWNAQTGELSDRWGLQSRNGACVGACFSPDSTMLACDASRADAGQALVRLLSGDAPRSLTFGKGSGTPLDRLVFSADGSGLVGVAGQSVGILPLSTPISAVHRLVEASLGLPGSPDAGPGTHVPLQPNRWKGADASALSPSGDRLAYLVAETEESPAWNAKAYARTVRVIALPSGQTIGTVKLPKSLWEMCFSADGRMLACRLGDDSHSPGSSGGCSISVFDVESGRTICELPRVGRGFTAMAFSPDGRTLAVGTADGAIQLCDTASGSPRASLRSAPSTVSK